MSKAKAELFSPVTGEDISFVGQAVSDFFKRNDWVEEYEFGPSLTRQDMAEECDINTIMAKYAVTGVLPGDPSKAQYVDFSTVPDNLLDAMQQLQRADAEFMRLPAHIRKEFDNDPIAFVEFAADPDNLDQLREWDLAPKKAPEAPQAPPEVQPADKAGDVSKAPGEPAKPA